MVPNRNRIYNEVAMEDHKQTEITQPQPLLDDQGHLLNPGYCKRNHYIYNKENIKKHRWRIKEWDYYMISDGRYMTELNFYNISIFAAMIADVIDLKTGKHYNDLVMEPSYPDKYKMSHAADKPFQFSYYKFGRKAEFITDASSHKLFFKGKYRRKDFKIDITGKRLPDQESITVATPFKNPHCFFYTQKLNCIQAGGTIKIAGQTIKYDPKDTYMVMDWGRGVWPWRNIWYWSNGSTVIDGKLFGFELTWGFGDESAATETAVFYDGKCHKIGRVSLEKEPEKEGWMKPWHFISEDGRLDLTLTPGYHRSNGLIFLKLIGMKSNQVFGKFNGSVLLDDGTRIEVKEMPAFAEKVYNCW